jgi:hypothetical protein
MRILHKKKLSTLYSSNYFVVVVGKSGALLLTQVDGRFGGRQYRAEALEGKPLREYQL